MRASHVALLRGINVGGKNKLPMADLVALFGAAGCTDVRTYIQSGNVVFHAKAAVAERVAMATTAAIRHEYGINAPIQIRTADEMRSIGSGHPLAEPGDEAKCLHVAFLADRPSSEAVEALDPDRSPGDTFRVVGRELYLRAPNGVARSKLTSAWMDASLHTISTARNWRTIGKLVQMLG